MSPTSSNSTVPPCASSSKPFRSWLAPVKEPRRWPKSSPSTRPGESAARQIGTNGPLLRRLWRWIAPRHQLFAGSALTRDQHRHVGRRDQGNALEQALHYLRGSDQGFECGRRRGLELAAGARLPFLERSLEHGPGLIQIKRLDQVLKSAPLHGPHHGLEIAKSRDHDDRRVAEPIAKSPQGGEPVHAGQSDVEHDGIERGDGGDFESLFGRRGDIHRVSEVGEKLAKGPADARLVVDDQDAAHRGSSAVTLARGSVKQKRVRMA